MLKHAFTRTRSGNAAARRFLALSLAFLLAISGLGAVGRLGARAEEGNGTVSVSKVDESKRPLAGATLQLLDSKGEIKDEWVSDGNSHVVHNLPYGSYTLHEKAAPAGYKAAADVPVVLAPAQTNPVQQDGKVVVNMGNSTGYSQGISMNSTAAYCLDRHTYYDLENAGKKEDLSKLDSGAVPADLQNSGNIVPNRDNIIRALIAGYPNDALGIGKKYNLSDKDFNRVTQDVIWKLVNGVEPGTYDTDRVDYKVHQSAQYKVYYRELLEAATDDTMDISGYDATIYWSPGSQPVVGALYNKKAYAEVTLVNKKLDTVVISLTKKWVDAQGKAVTDLEGQWATFQLYQDGAPYRGEVRLDNTTGWSHSFGDDLPAGHQYEVKEVGSSGTGLDTKPEVSYTELTQPDQTITRTETKKGLQEVAPQVGGTYIIHVETLNANDGENNIRVLTDPLSATQTPPTNLDSIPAGYQWTLIDAKDGLFVLQSDRGNRIYYKGQSGASTLNADLAPSSQTAGAKLRLVSGGDGIYRLRSWHMNNNYIMSFTNSEIKFVKDNTQSAAGIDNQVRFYEVVTETVKVTETIPGSTQTTGAAYSFTNKVEKETTSINVAKVWDDANNQDGIRPGSVTLQLYADGEAVTGKTIELNAENGWKGSFTDLPAKKDGKDIAYTVDEPNVPTGYTKSVSEDGLTVTNKHTPETTSINVAKVWDDANNQDGIRPGSVTLQLYADGEAVTGKTIELNAENGWKGSFTDLPAKKGGKDIAYTVDEPNVPTGYTKSVSEDGLTVTNKHTPETTSINVAKVWDDANNQDGLRKEITIQLYADGVAVEGKALKLDGSKLTGSFTGLPKYNNGVEIQYTVQEVNVPEGYTAETTGSMAEGFTITNKHTPETTEVEVTKVWDDNNNQDDKRPASVTVQLKANGVVKKTEILSASNDWSFKFEGLNKCEGGELITYTVEEVMPEGYTNTVSGNMTDGFTITNRYTPDKTQVDVSKVWTDENNKYGHRPVSIIFTLWADGVKVASREVKEIDGWKWTFGDLDKFKGGIEIKYTVTEETVKNYETVISATDTGFTVTNTLKTFPVQISKVDIADSKELEGATLQIKRGDKLLHEWVSTKETHKVQLPAGEYSLIETVAPDGYIIATEIRFTVKENGSVDTQATLKDGVILVEDDCTKVTIKKTDITGTKEIGGAVLQIKDGDKVVEEWTSVEGKSHEINAKLVAGKTYKLVEITAPDGYLVAEEIEFTVNTDGKVQTVEMKDDYKPQPVKISKTDLVSGKEIAGAVIVLKDEAGQEIKTWTSEEGKAMELNLKPGTYTFQETNAPEGYVKVETAISFTVDMQGNITVDKTTVEPADAVEVKDGTIFLKNELQKQKVKVNKTDMGGVEVDGARVVVKDEDGNLKSTWTSKIGETMELELLPGKYILAEVSAPKEYERVTTEIGFTVDRTGTITVDKVTVEPAGAVEVKDGVIILMNALKTKATTAAEEEEKETSTEPDEGGTLPPGGGEDEESVNGESEEVETEPDTEPDEGGTLPPGEEEESTPVDAETEAPATLPPTEQEKATTVNAETQTPVPDTGDHSHISLYLGLMATAAAGSLLLLGLGQNRSKEE